ncbi:MAG: hypothetical protein ABL927_03360 [Bdellovibrionales bacterium]
MKLIFISLFFYTCFGLSAPKTIEKTHLSQNDISILMPVPLNPLEDHLLRASSEGAFGELFPRRFLDQMPELVFEPADETYKKLRVIAVRIDPCFPTTLIKSGCQPQVRMIWQPLVQRSRGEMKLLDAAVHTFYNLTAADFSTLIQQLEALKASFQFENLDEILTINPQLKKLGLSSDYAKKLFSILLSHTGAERLQQATFMQLTGTENVWIFGGVFVLNGQINLLPIPRVGGFTQAFTNNTRNGDFFQHGGAHPAPQGQDNINLLIGESRNIKPSDEATVIENTMSAFRIENPNLHNPSTMDCVTCHAAQPARLWAIKQYPWLSLNERGEEFKFKSKFDLTNSSTNPSNTKLMRAFGYDGIEPAISQRTINETAKILEGMY